MIGKGVVVNRSGDRATVMVSIDAECAGCHAKEHCHSGAEKPREITVINDIDADVSDHVVFEADSGRVLLSAALIWILPVCAMIVGYAAGKRIGGGAVPIVAAFTFLGLTFVLLKGIDRIVSGGRTFYPYITRIIPPESDDEPCGALDMMQ